MKSNKNYISDGIEKIIKDETVSWILCNSNTIKANLKRDQSKVLIIIEKESYGYTIAITSGKEAKNLSISSFYDYKEELKECVSSPIYSRIKSIFENVRLEKENKEYEEVANWIKQVYFHTSDIKEEITDNKNINNDKTENIVNKRTRTKVK